MRGKKAKVRSVGVDVRYKSQTLYKFINKVMVNGKKTVARSIVYKAFDQIEKEFKADPMSTFEKAIGNTVPTMEVRSRRVGGANYQVPIAVEGARSESLAVKWIITYARLRKGMPMFKKLALELVDASNNTGGAVKKKEEVHKMSEANRAFSHFR